MAAKTYRAKARCLIGTRLVLPGETFSYELDKNQNPGSNWEEVTPAKEEKAQAKSGKD